MVTKTRPTNTAHIRVALLTNSLSPHTLPLCERIHEATEELRAFVSAASDTFHNFPRPQASFPIVVQRSMNGLRLRHRTEQFSISEQLHVPLDTLPHLWQYKPDVIVSSQFGARTAFAIVYRMLHPRVKLILWAALSTHTEEKRSRLRGALRRWMLRRVDAAFVNGKSGEEYLRSLGYRENICFVPYTIDETGFRSPGYAPRAEETRLLFCGRIDITKGILRFTQVLHRWCADHPEKHIRFQIIGDGPDRELIQSLPPLPNLSFSLLPRMEQKQLAAFYHQADIFAFPSMLDEWGVVVNEALIAGLPVLGSIYSQASLELVSEGANGWLFDPKRDDSIYDSLQRALTTPLEQLHSMSAYARCTAQEVAPERIARRAMQSIAELCGISAKLEEPASPELAMSPSGAVSAL